MSTLSLPPKLNENTFSYAAAASGKHSPKPGVSNAGAGVVNNSQTSMSDAITINGDTVDNSKTQSTDIGTLPEIKSGVSHKSGVATPQISSNVGNPSLNGDSAQSLYSLDQKLAKHERSPAVENALQGSANWADNIKEGTKTPEVIKDKLVPAPPPPVNIWTQRAEEFTAKSKLQTPALVSMPSALIKQPTSKGTEKPVEAKQSDRKRNNKQESGHWESKDNGAHDRKDNGRDGRDRKKSADTGRTNGYPPRDDGKYLFVKLCQNM